MKVTLIAHTVVVASPTDQWDISDHVVSDADLLAETAGRSCYASWSNPSGRDNAEYLANILNQGHYSVLEHGSATFYVEGVSRALTHELIRHRHLSYSQLSQRFVDESQRAEVVVPPAFKGSPSARRLLAMQEYLANQQMSAYVEAVDLLTKEGKTRKEAREAARAFLPNATSTSLVVTGNHRAWRDFLAKRWSTHADAEIREFAGLVLKELRVIAPNSYQDIPEEPYS